MREIQITVQLPDEFDSLEQLELMIHHQGNKIKQHLFEKELARRIDK